MTSRPWQPADQPIGRRRWLRNVLTTACLGCGCPPARGAEWPSQWQLGSMIYHADFHLAPEAEIVQETVTLRRTIPTDLKLVASQEPIYLYLFRQQATYRRYLQEYFPNVPERRALFIKQRGPGMVFAFYSDELAVDIRHETTHAVLHTALPMVPLWLDEGLAEYFEVPTSARYAGSPHLRSVRRNVRWWRRPSLTKLEAIDDLTGMQNNQYRDAWAWVHFMLHGPPIARDEFQCYLADLQAHTPPGILSRRLQRRMPDLDRQFARHFEQLQKSA